MTRLPLQTRLRSNRRRTGFTLVEVLLVLAILGVIAAMVVPNLLGNQKKAMIQTSKMSIKGLEDACKTYAVAHDGEYPTGIGELLNPPNEKDGKASAPYLEKEPKDAWGIMLNYEYPTSKVPGGTKPAIWSNGPNKTSDDGGGDDVNNWSN